LRAQKIVKTDDAFAPYVIQVPSPNGGSDVIDGTAELQGPTGTEVSIGAGKRA
jgi:hypothetical protein